MKHNVDRIQSRLHRGEYQCAWRIDWFEEIDSTNSYLLQHPDASYRACIAESQTAGRGRRGRQWVSEPSTSVLLSIGWSARGPEQKNRLLQGLSLVCGLAVMDVLSQYGVSGLALKWPNDILAQGKKLVGILVELNQLNFVVGIGININLSQHAHSEIDQPWIDLYSLGVQPDRDNLVADLILIHHKYLKMMSSQGFAPFKDRWNSAHAFSGKRVSVTGEGRKIEGMALGVNEDGEFMLDYDGDIVIIRTGEYSIRSI